MGGFFELVAPACHPNGCSEMGSRQASLTDINNSDARPSGLTCHARSARLGQQPLIPCITILPKRITRGPVSAGVDNRPNRTEITMGAAVADITDEIVSRVPDIRSVPISRLTHSTKGEAINPPEPSAFGGRVAVAAFTSSI